MHLASPEGFPSSVLVASFANQALSAESKLPNSASLKNDGEVVPGDIDDKIAGSSLTSRGQDRHADA